MTNSSNQTQVAGIPGGRINPVEAGLKEQSSTKVTQVNMKEVAIVVAAVLFISGLVGGYVFYTQQREAGGTVTTNTEVTIPPAKPAPLPEVLSPLSWL